jgi:hypothetical protein
VATGAGQHRRTHLLSARSGDPRQGKKAYTFVFVDGGVTTYNNAAFLAYQMATAAPYHINWKTGTDQLLIVSVGTGSALQPDPTCSRVTCGWWITPRPCPAP